MSMFEPVQSSWAMQHLGNPIKSWQPHHFLMLIMEAVNRTRKSPLLLLIVRFAWNPWNPTKDTRSLHAGIRFANHVCIITFNQKYLAKRFGY
jgi:hypothetical protein